MVLKRLRQLAYRGIPLQTAYCGAKHAIQGFHEALRCELLHEHSKVHVTMVQMPAGIPVGTLAIGRAGAINAALLATAILATTDAALAERLDAWRTRQTGAVATEPTSDTGVSGA